MTMGQILIISDSHFLRKKDLDQFIASIPHIDATIHCGDIYLGYKPGDIANLYMCKGNNDFADIPYISHFTIDNTTFTITHGHRNNYAYNPTTLKQLLIEYPADVICFGHTHIPYFYQDEDIIIINPGSLTLGRSYPKKNTYAIFDTQTQIVHFYDIKTGEEIIVEKKNTKK